MAKTNVYRDRLSFAKIPEVMDIPNLISIQTAILHLEYPGIHVKITV